MRKLTALALAIALALLCGCIAFEPEETTAPETTACIPETIAYVPPTTAPWEPNDPPAIMEPLQGGPMLYYFMARKPYKYTKEVDSLNNEYDRPRYLYGLVNQNAELVAAPHYDEYPQYFYDATGRAMGVVVQRDQEHYIYSLDGKRTKINTTCCHVHILPGGRYAIIDTVEPHAEENVENKGLYDLHEQKYIIAPDGQYITYNGMVFGSGWYFNPADGSMHEAPPEWGVPREYYPEVGWFRTREGREDRYFDSEWNEVSWELARYYIEPNRELWIDTGYDKRILKDRTGNIIYTPIEGERLEELHELGDYGYLAPLAFLVLDANDNVKQVFAPDRTPWRPLEGIYQNESHGCVESMLFRLEGGKWQMIDYASFIEDKPALNHSHSVRVCDDYVVMMVAWDDGDFNYENAESFAVDWDGNKMSNCPLEPFFPYLGPREQQGDYYWVELDGQRGYINTRGEWLFVE